jgi:hypothetical protein
MDKSAVKKKKKEENWSPISEETWSRYGWVLDLNVSQPITSIIFADLIDLIKIIMLPLPIIP